MSLCNIITLSWMCYDLISHSFVFILLFKKDKEKKKYEEWMTYCFTCGISLQGENLDVFSTLPCAFSFFLWLLTVQCSFTVSVRWKLMQYVWVNVKLVLFCLLLIVVGMFSLLFFERVKSSFSIVMSSVHIIYVIRSFN